MADESNPVPALAPPAEAAPVQASTPPAGPAPAPAPAPPKRWKVEGRKRSGLPPAVVEAPTAEAAEAIYRKKYNLSGYAPLVVTEAA